MKYNKKDRLFSELLKQNILEAPPSPWFTRKVLNRLPEREIRIASYIEYVIYIIGIVISVIVTVNEIKATIASGIVTVGDLCSYGILLSLILSLFYMILSPFAVSGH